LLVAWLWTACQTPPTAPSVPSHEQSVRPEINKEYLKPDLKVGKWVERFEREGREIYDHRHDIIKAARIQLGSTVADIGAGTGLFTLLIAEAVGPRGKVYAVDIVKEFLGHIDGRAAQQGRRNVRTILCTERSVELPAHSIDLAFVCDTYHHFEYPHSTLASIHRALRPGGELVLIDFKRVPGESSQWVMDHVRAGQDIVTAEIISAGFELVGESAFLRDNYFLRFRKRGK
jgi:predicted methyltransferase